jgi:hypothetical protein
LKRKAKTKRYNQNKNFEESSDENFYYITGYTDGGAPYGMTWEEIIAQELKFRGGSQKGCQESCGTHSYRN